MRGLPARSLSEASRRSGKACVFPSVYWRACFVLGEQLFYKRVHRLLLAVIPGGGDRGCTAPSNTPAVSLADLRCYLMSSLNFLKSGIMVYIVTSYESPRSVFCQASVVCSVVRCTVSVAAAAPPLQQTRKF